MVPGKRLYHTTILDVILHVQELYRQHSKWKIFVVCPSRIQCVHYNVSVCVVVVVGGGGLFPGWFKSGSREKKTC